MGQILTAWESAVLEALNLSDRIREQGEVDLANAILRADENRDREALLEALENVSETYNGEEEERIREIASAIAFRISNPERHNVDYLLDTAEWLPRVPYGLEPYGLSLTMFQHKDGHEARFWTIPGAPLSEEFGAILVGYDLLSNEKKEPFIGLRMFFEHVVNNQELTTMLDDEEEEITVPMDETEEINFYKCVLPDSKSSSLEKTIGMIRNALFLDETLSQLEAAAKSKTFLSVFPNAPEIPTVL